MQQMIIFRSTSNSRYLLQKTVLSNYFALKSTVSKNYNKNMSTKSCLFCKIVGKDAPATIKFENEEIVIFEDIKPVAKHHYLSVPKEHIVNVNNLSTPEHKGLLERLIKEGKNVIQKEGGDLNDLKMGFHLPPFNTVGHLHLHLVSPASGMSFLHRMMFKDGTWWYASVEEIREKLNKIEQGEGNNHVSNKL